MKKNQINKIETMLRKIPQDRFPSVMNFLNWMNNADDILTESEVEILRKSRMEKGGIPWLKLRRNV